MILENVNNNVGELLGSRGGRGEGRVGKEKEEDLWVKPVWYGQSSDWERSKSGDKGQRSGGRSISSAEERSNSWVGGQSGGESKRGVGRVQQNV
ncbi:hypothetical protein Tco_1578502 [Tanacetum coccineum]